MAWSPGSPIGRTGRNALMTALVCGYRATVQWDPLKHESWFCFYRDQMRDWVFMSGARPFRDRYEAVRQDGPQGFGSWVLGAEDPAAWRELPEAGHSPQGWFRPWFRGTVVGV